MLNWIYSLFRQSMSGLTQLWNWVVSAFSAVYSYIDIEIRMIEREATGAWNAAFNLFREAERFAESIYVTLGDALYNMGRTLIRELARQWDILYHYTLGVYSSLVKWVDFFGKLIISIQKDILDWVLKHVWLPLYKDVLGILQWISTHGSYIVSLITQPDLLIKLLGHWLWISWQDMLKKDGKTAARWILHSALGLGRELASILETIITGIL